MDRYPTILILSQVKSRGCLLNRSSHLVASHAPPRWSTWAQPNAQLEPKELDSLNLQAKIQVVQICNFTRIFGMCFPAKRRKNYSSSFIYIYIDIYTNFYIQYICGAARKCCCAVIARAALTAKQQVQHRVRPVAQSLQPHGLRLLVEEGFGVDGAPQLPGQPARPWLLLALAAVPLWCKAWSWALRFLVWTTWGGYVGQHGLARGAVWKPTLFLFACIGMWF